MSNRLKYMVPPKSKFATKSFLFRRAEHERVSHLCSVTVNTSKTPYVAIDERGLVRSIHLFLFSCVH